MTILGGVKEKGLLAGKRVLLSGSYFVGSGKYLCPQACQGG